MQNEVLEVKRDYPTACEKCAHYSSCSLAGEGLCVQFAEVANADTSRRAEYLSAFYGYLDAFENDTGTYDFG